MCRIEEKIYVGSDGRRKTFEDTFPCDRARRRGKQCSKLDKRTRQYTGAPPIARDDAPSPASNNPPTPTGVGSYIVEERRPSGSGRRPSLKPEIVIQIGGSKRDKDKKYPRAYISTAHKRSSLGASSTISNDAAVESPGSDASYTIRTGLPETTLPAAAPFGQSHGYTTRHIVPQSHRHTPSASSVTTSQTPSLYTTSETEPESPLGRHAPQYPRTIVHNTRPKASSPVTAHTQSSAYHTRLEVPKTSSRDTASSREHAGDYSDVFDIYNSSNGSNASSSRAVAPEITDRAIDRDRRRKRKEEEKKKQEEEERRLDEELSKASEHAKQVRFAELETGRYAARDQLRKEKQYHESEKRRAEEREKERERRKEAEKWTTKEPERRAKKKPEREKTQPPTRDFNKKPSGRHSRRNSMTQADFEERERLLLQEKLQMSLEREAANQRDREERAAEARQQQFSTRQQAHSTPSYYMDEARSPPSTGNRREGISMNPPAPGRTNSARRPSIVQPNPPTLAQQSYSTRPPSSHNTQPYTTREQLPSARYSPSQLGPPFPPPRTSNSSMESNPFAAPSTRPIHPTISTGPTLHQYHPVATGSTWDTGAMQSALPPYPQGQASQYAPQGYSQAQQATLNLNQAYGNNHAEDAWL